MTHDLTKAIEALRARLHDQHGNEYTKLVELNARMEQHDENIIRELNFVIQGQEDRRAEIHRLVRLLAGRVGALPAPAPEPINLSEPIELPRVYHNAAEDLANAVNGAPH